MINFLIQYHLLIILIGYALYFLNKRLSFKSSDDIVERFNTLNLYRRYGRKGSK